MEPSPARVTEQPDGDGAQTQNPRNVTSTGRDGAGNRKTAAQDGQGAEYTANRLNQYSQRTVATGVHVFGSANASNPVLVNARTAARHGEYFHKLLGVTNAEEAVYLPIRAVTGAPGGGGSMIQLLAQHPARALTITCRAIFLETACPPRGVHHVQKVNQGDEL